MPQTTLGVSPPAPPPPSPPHRGGHLNISSETVATSPADRARTTIGVGERVRIRITHATGTISWSKTGSSRLSSTSGLSITLTAHDRAESTKVTATDSCGCVVEITFNVIEPSGVTMERAPGTNIWHTHNIPSVGIKLQAYITPDNVSFENIECSEDDATGIVTGYFVGTPLDGVRHAGHGAGSWVALRNHVAGKGTQDGAIDTAQSGHCNYGTPYRIGTFDWPIPWLFKANGGASKQFTIVHQRFTIDASGNMTASKAGASGSARFNDPNSSY